MTVQGRLAGRLDGRCGRLAYVALKAAGVEIPRSVVIGDNFDLPHGAVGLVVHPRTRIGSNVRIFGGVTLGRADNYLDVVDLSPTAPDADLVNIVIEDDVIIGAGAKVLFSASGAGRLHIGRGAVVAANAVVLCDVPGGEVWGGIPAKRLAMREPSSTWRAE